MKQTKYFFLLQISIIAFLAFAPSPAFANNLSISNVRILNCSSSSQTALVEFDISWNNSWRDSVNHDAVWVFMKGYAASEVGDPDLVNYVHFYLASSGTNPTGFSTGSGAIEIIVPSDKAGAFIRKSQFGSSGTSSTNVQLVWDYTTVTGASCSAATQVSVFGIEMVYIPEGGFHAGDGNNGATNYEFEYGSSSSLPVPINSETGISFANVSAGGWYYNSTGDSPEFSSGAVFNVNSSYPKGYQAFYAMKYELSQGQYVAFLNSLSRNQQINRVASGASANTIANNFVMSNTTGASSRNTVTCPSTGNGTVDPIVFSASSSVGTGRENRAMAYLSWMDLAAYADWAALRPMTELEYEKVSRGPVYPLPSEFAWGSTSVTAAATFTGSEIGSERISTANANANYNGTALSGGDTGSGPIRCGIFATSATSTRVTSGAGYYGNMELSGNVMELVVTIGNSIGISFSGTHGDGTLSNLSGSSYDGNATNLDWPGIDTTDSSRGVTGANGAGDRGGGWNRNSTQIATSYRGRACTNDSSRDSQVGGRLVRTAP